MNKPAFWTADNLAPLIGLVPPSKYRPALQFRIIGERTGRTTHMLLEVLAELLNSDRVIYLNFASSTHAMAARAQVAVWIADLVTHKYIDERVHGSIEDLAKRIRSFSDTQRPMGTDLVATDHYYISREERGYPYKIHRLFVMPGQWLIDPDRALKASIAYDGPEWHALREKTYYPMVIVISAQHGILTAEDKIFSEREMTDEIVERWQTCANDQEALSGALNYLRHARNYQIVWCLPRLYLSAINPDTICLEDLVLDPGSADAREEAIKNLPIYLSVPPRYGMSNEYITSMTISSC